MAQGRGVETLSELQIWIEGQFNLVTQSQATTATDITQVREKMHRLSNSFASLVALDIPGKIEQLQAADRQHEVNIERFIKEAAERRGAVAALKFVYAVFGAVIGAGITLAIGLHG